MDLNKFSERMRLMGDGIRKNATDLQRRTAGAILSTVVMATPVGQPTIWASRPKAGYVGGRARGNWQVSIGHAGTGEVTTPDKAGASTVSKGMQEIGGSTPGTTIHITNNVPYIIHLNNGSSKQAPIGFIETAIMQGANAAHAAKVVPK